MGSDADTFVQNMPASLRGPARALGDLPARVAALADAAAARVAGVDPSDFLRHVAALLPDDGRPADALDVLHVSDLALAWAAAAGDEAAVAELTSSMRPVIATAAARVLGNDEVDDLVADVMGKLLVAVAPARPGLLKYAGRGRLSKWVQTVAVRAAHSRTRKRTEQPSDNIESLAERILEAGDPELTALKQTYRVQFKAAFRQAIDGLPAQRRNVLRLELLDGLTIEAIARVHGVHAATIFRWRAQTRAELLETTRSVFQREHNVGRDEFHSIMRLIGSQLEVSLPRLLDETDDDDG